MMGEPVVEGGVLLAVVERGGVLKKARQTDSVPGEARRKAGAAVRVTYMYYGLAADGAISAERARRFTQQASFRRRALGLPHGSLVSGLGSWGGPEDAPIKLFGFRLTDANERWGALDAVRGVSAVPMPETLQVACKALAGIVPSIEGAAQQAERAAQALVGSGDLSTHAQVAAIYLYTMAHSFYRQLNAAMRDSDRSKVNPFFSYLRLLLAGLHSLHHGGPLRALLRGGSTGPKTLWRGVNLDLSDAHPEGGEVVWWGASSCTPKMSVAKGFLGSHGTRTLFVVRHLSAVPIKQFSAFRGEEEWLLAPGTRLRIDSVSKKGGGLIEIHLNEQPPPRAVD